jgi:hypothetical protein
MRDGSFDVGITESGQTFASGTPRVNRRQALFAVAAMFLEMSGDERLHQIAVIGVKIAPGDQMIGHGPFFVVSPRLKRGDELYLVDHTVLKREQAKEQFMRWVDRRWHVFQLRVGSRGPAPAFRQMIPAQGVHDNDLAAGLHRTMITHSWDRATVAS